MLDPCSPLIEALSAKFHAIYQQEAARQGDIRHPDAYDALPEHTKEFDRVLARFVYKHSSGTALDKMLNDPLTTP